MSKGDMVLTGSNEVSTVVGITVQVQTRSLKYNKGYIFTYMWVGA